MGEERQERDLTTEDREDLPEVVGRAVGERQLFKEAGEVVGRLAHRSGHPGVQTDQQGEHAEAPAADRLVDQRPVFGAAEARVLGDGAET